MPPTVFHELGAFVRERRKAEGLTQEDMANIAGVGRRFVSELERGKRSLRLDSVEAVLRVFGRGLGVVVRRGDYSEQTEEGAVE